MARRDIIDLTNDDKTSVTSDEGRLPHRLSRRAHRASQSRDPPLASVSTTPKRKRKAHQLHDHLTISSGDDTKIVSADDSRPASGVPTRVKSHELQPARKKTRTPSDQPSPTKGQDLAASTKRQPGLTTTLHESINSAKTSNRRIGVVSNETVLENDAAPIASTDSSTRLRDATVNRSKVSEAEEVGIARIDTVNPSKHLRNAVANPLRVSEAAAARLADTAMVYSSRLINYDDRISHKTSILSGEGGPRVVEEDATSPKEVTQVRSFDAVDTANADSNQGAHEVESTEQRRTVPIVNHTDRGVEEEAVSEIVRRHVQKCLKDREAQLSSLLEHQRKAIKRCNDRWVDKENPFLKLILASRSSANIENSKVTSFVHKSCDQKRVPHHGIPSMISEIRPSGTPKYSHYTEISSNILAENKHALLSIPFFENDEQTDEVQNELTKQLPVLNRDRDSRNISKGRGITWSRYAEDILRESQCSWSDVLRYFKEPNLLESFSDLPTMVGVKVRDRNIYAPPTELHIGEIDSTWEDLLNDKVPEMTKQSLVTAALVSAAFWKETKFSLFELARQWFIDWSTREDLANKKVPKEDLLCEICKIHDCPYHGVYEDGDILDNKLDCDEEILLKPGQHNQRFRFTALKKPPLEQGVPALSSRGWAVRWMEQGTGRPKPKMGNAHEPQQTQIFRPCDHDGPCETAAECSCFELKIPCEKTCGCNAQCLRRFPGCDCKREGRPCLHVDIATQRRTVCLCLQLNRECDPDTCGSCGVREVLDPVNRHCELPPPVCGNCAIQRRMRKHTLIGNSDVEGFGLFAVEEIKKDELIGEYTGELITIDEFDRRFQVTVHRNYSYGFELHRDIVIDSTRAGNKMRFINSAQWDDTDKPKHKHKATAKRTANCYPRIKACNTVCRIGIYAARPIHVHEELLYNYGGKFHGATPSKTVSSATKRARSTTSSSVNDDDDDDDDDDEDGDDGDSNENGNLNTTTANPQKVRAYKTVPPTHYDNPSAPSSSSSSEYHATTEAESQATGDHGGSARGEGRRAQGRSRARARAGASGTGAR